MPGHRPHVRQASSRFGDQHTIGTEFAGKQPPQIGHLRQIVDHDIGSIGIQGRIVLMIELGRIENTARLDAGDDGCREHVGGIKLSDVGLRKLGLLGVGNSAERYCVPEYGPCRLSSVGSCATEK